jgi:hypothetical protein
VVFHTLFYAYGIYTPSSDEDVGRTSARMRSFDDNAAWAGANLPPYRSMEGALRLLHTQRSDRIARTDGGLLRTLLQEKAKGGKAVSVSLDDLRMGAVVLIKYASCLHSPNYYAARLQSENRRFRITQVGGSSTGPNWMGLDTTYFYPDRFKGWFVDSPNKEEPFRLGDVEALVQPAGM